MSDKEKINFKDRYETEAGRPARIICIDYVESANLKFDVYRVIALIKDIHGNEHIALFDEWGNPQDTINECKLIKYDPVKYLKRGDPVLVSIDGGTEWVKAHYHSKTQTSDKYATFKDGKSDWTGSHLEYWKHIRVPEPLQK